MSVAPLIGSDPIIEAAKIAANSFFSKPVSSQLVQAVHRSDPTAGGFISRVEPALAANAAMQKPASDLVASLPAQPAGQAEKPRSGRVLQSLIVEDPIDALLRLEDEERSTRKRPRGPRIRSVFPDGTRAAVPTGSRQIPAHKMSAEPGTSFTESPVSTDIVEPRRKLRGRTVMSDPNPAVGTPRGKSVKKQATTAPGRTGSLRRTADEGAGAKQRAQKRASTGRFDKKSIATRAAAKKSAGKAAVAKKTTVRKGEAKGSRGRSTLAKERSVATRAATTLSRRKLATKKIGKTNRSARGTSKTSTRTTKGATRRARHKR